MSLVSRNCSKSNSNQSESDPEQQALKIILIPIFFLELLKNKITRLVWIVIATAFFLGRICIFAFAYNHSTISN